MDTERNIGSGDIQKSGIKGLSLVENIAQAIREGRPVEAPGVIRYRLANLPGVKPPFSQRIKRTESNIYLGRYR